MEKIKDFFHDFSDVFFAIIVATIMFTVLALNLGSWFDKSSNTTLENNSTNAFENINNKQDNSQTNINNNDNELQTSNSNKVNDLETSENINQNETENLQNHNNINSNVEKNEQNSDVVQETKKIVIPNGTFGTGIAKILKDNGLIDNVSDFVEVAENLNLSSRFKSGSFEIPVNASIEDMAKIIAGEKNM